MKKAQAAMEFLTTYGWALLIVISAIGAFSYYIGVNPASKIPASCNLGMEFSCGSYIASNEGVLVYEFTNLVGKPINITHIEFKLQNGRREVIEYDDVRVEAGETVTACTYSPNVELNFGRSKERLDVKIYYKIDETGALPKFTEGTIVTNIIEHGDIIEDNLDNVNLNADKYTIYDADGDIIDDDDSPPEYAPVHSE